MTNIDYISKEDQKKRLMKMITFLEEICKKYNIQYFLDSGSLLGAIRHQGFIPWDDDLDIILFREDYDKLVTLLQNTYPYKVIDHHYTEGYIMPFAKLVDSTTKLVNNKIIETNELGLFIDLFPIDNIPDNWIKKKLYFNEIWYLRKLAWLPSVKKIENLSF